MEFSIHLQVDFDFLVPAQTFDIKTPKMNCRKLQKNVVVFTLLS